MKFYLIEQRKANGEAYKHRRFLCDGYTEKVTNCRCYPKVFATKTAAIHFLEAKWWGSRYRTVECEVED